MEENNKRPKDIRNKIRKNFFAGFGAGLIVIAISIMIFSKYINKTEKSMSTAVLIEKAKELGMVFPEELDGPIG